MNFGTVGSRCLITHRDLPVSLRINVQNIAFVAGILFDDIFRNPAFVLDDGILRAGHGAVFQDQAGLIVRNDHIFRVLSGIVIPVLPILFLSGVREVVLNLAGRGIISEQAGILGIISGIIRVSPLVCSKQRGRICNFVAAGAAAAGRRLPGRKDPLTASLFSAVQIPVQFLPPLCLSLIQQGGQVRLLILFDRHIDRKMKKVRCGDLRGKIGEGCPERCSILLIHGCLKLLDRACERGRRAFYVTADIIRNGLQIKNRIVRIFGGSRNVILDGPGGIRYIIRKRVDQRIQLV